MNVLRRKAAILVTCAFALATLGGVPAIAASPGTGGPPPPPAIPRCVYQQDGTWTGGALSAMFPLYRWLNSTGSDDFVASADCRVRSVEVLGMNQGCVPASWTVTLYSWSWFGGPYEPIYTYTGPGTNIAPGYYDTYKMSFESPTLTAGASYWISVVGNEPKNCQYSSGWSWMTTTTLSGQSGYYKSANPGSPCQAWTPVVVCNSPGSQGYVFKLD